MPFPKSATRIVTAVSPLRIIAADVGDLNEEYESAVQALIEAGERLTDASAQALNLGLIPAAEFKTITQRAIKSTGASAQATRLRTDAADGHEEAAMVVHVATVRRRAAKCWEYTRELLRRIAEASQVHVDPVAQQLPDHENIATEPSGAARVPDSIPAAKTRVAPMRLASAATATPLVAAPHESGRGMQISGAGLTGRGKQSIARAKLKAMLIAPVLNGQNDPKTDEPWQYEDLAAYWRAVMRGTRQDRNLLLEAALEGDSKARRVYRNISAKSLRRWVDKASKAEREAAAEGRFAPSHAQVLVHTYPRIASRASSPAPSATWSSTITTIRRA